MKFLEKLGIKRSKLEMKILPSDTDTVLVSLGNGRDVAFTLVPFDGKMETWDEFVRSRDFKLVDVARKKTNQELIENTEPKRVDFKEQAGRVNITEGEYRMMMDVVEAEFVRRHSKGNRNV